MLFSGTGAAALPAVGPGMAGAVGGDEVRWKKIKELITRATADTPTAPKSRNLGDREVVFIKVKQVQAQAVFHFTLTQVMQVRLPVPVLGQILGYMPG